MIVNTSRTWFNETWLKESPQLSGPTNTYEDIVTDITMQIKSQQKIISLGNDLFKIVTKENAYYWYQDGDTITLGCELDIMQQAYGIRLTGKNPAYIGKPPRASDLYNAILNDIDKSPVIYSDINLSDEGYAIWKKMFELGHKISVYDRTRPTQTFKTFEDTSELENYIGKDRSFKNYRFIMSEVRMLGDTIQAFNTRRYRELSGLALKD